MGGYGHYIGAGYSSSCIISSTVVSRRPFLGGWYVSCNHGGEGMEQGGEGLGRLEESVTDHLGNDLKINLLY